MLTNDETKKLMTLTESIIKSIYPKFNTALTADVVNEVVLKALKKKQLGKIMEIPQELYLKQLMYEAVWYNNDCQCVQH